MTVQGVHSTYVIKIWAEVRTATCAGHAYGNAVVAYLRKHPCRGLTRQLGTTVVDGRGVGFARSVLGFAGTAPGVYSVAGDFETLVSKDGTGNLADLFRSGYRLPSGPARVPSPDAFNVQGQDAGVIVLDAWYLSGRTPENDPPLTQLGEETFGQF